MSTLYRHGESGRSKVRHEGLYTAVRSLTACRVDGHTYQEPRRSQQAYGCIRCVAYDVLGSIDMLTISDLGYHKIRCDQTFKFI